MNLIKTQELESILLANWAKFIDTTKLLAFTLQTVREHDNWTRTQEKAQKENLQISVSKVSWNSQGNFYLWIDFNVPTLDGIAVGTVEATIDSKGTIKHLDTSGVLFCGDVGNLNPTRF